MDAGNPDIDYFRDSCRLGGLCLCGCRQNNATASHPDSAGADKRSAVAAEPGSIQPFILGAGAFDGVPYLVIGDRIRSRRLFCAGHVARMANIIGEGGIVAAFIRMAA